MKTLKKVLGDASMTKDTEDFVKKHVIKKVPDANGNGDEVFNGSTVAPVDRAGTRHGYNPGQDEEVYEELSDDDMAERERLVKGMKKNFSSFKQRYGKDAESVMYATATKMAQEETQEQDEDQSALRQQIEEEVGVDTGLVDDIVELYSLLDENQQTKLVDMLEEEKYDDILTFIETLGDE